MHVTNFNTALFSEAYGILCAPVKSDNAHQAMYPTFCKIPPTCKTIRHYHFEAELFYIISGQGEMRIDDKSSMVSTGDLICIPPFSFHELQNISDGDLDFLSVYSEDIEIGALPSSVIVTAAPPTPNGPLHLGHISGPYLASDVIARHLKQKDVEVKTHCGTDDHQNYVTERARGLDQDPETFRKTMRERIIKGLDYFNIEFCEKIEPKNDQVYQQKVQDFFVRAKKLSIIEKVNVLFPHCQHCQLYLVDALIEGSCPACLEVSRGGCESCGVVVAPNEIIDPLCSRCKKPAQALETLIYVFDLKKHLPLIEKDLAQLSLNPRLNEMINRIQTLDKIEVLVTHPDPLQYSIPAQGTAQSLHVWFEMAAHYEKFATGPDFWIHHFGFDNGFYYILFIPSLLRSMNPRAKLPGAMVTNEFLQLEGLKFSTSRHHAIWADEFKGKTDHLRLYLLLNRPVSSENNFSMNAFESFSADLSHQLQKLSSLPICHEASENTAALCHRMTREMDAALHPSQLDYRKASRLLLLYLDIGIQEGKLNLQMQANLKRLMEPFMPNEARDFSEKLELAHEL